MIQELTTNNIATTANAVTDYNPNKASLLEMRADSKRFPRLKSVSREQAIFDMSRIVSQAFLYRGQLLDKQNILFISTTLVDELLEDDIYGAGTISFAEIQVVVKRAILGSDIYISVSSLYKIIMDFVKGEGHNNQKQVNEAKRKEEEKRLQGSALKPMLQAYTGEFIRNNKINNKTKHQ